MAGALVTIDRKGEAVIHRGLRCEVEAKVPRTLQRLRRGLAEGGATNEGDVAAEAPKAANVSDRLAQWLSAHRTVVLQIEVGRHPRVALAALVHSPDWPQSPAAVALRATPHQPGAALAQAMGLVQSYAGV